MANHNKALQQAIDALQINDVYLKSTQAHCDNDFDAKSSDVDSLLLQQMHIVQNAEVVQVDDSTQFLRINVRLGARWVVAEGDDQPGEDADVKAFIEADFIAEYLMNSELEEPSIAEFAQKNASYHVWPYWREYLASQCERFRLPRLMLPATQFNKPS